MDLYMSKMVKRLLLKDAFPADLNQSKSDIRRHDIFYSTTMIL